MENKTGISKKIAKSTVSVLLAGCLIGSLGLNIYQADRASAQNKKVNKFIDGQLERQAKEEEQENTYQEDGYMIGEQYEIRSTTQISDAYLNKDDSNLDKEDKKTLELAQDVLKEIITDDMDDYEKELAVYEWMYENIGQGSGSSIALPGADNEAYTPYGVLTGKNAVCVGYATTFRLFMNMLEMDCHIVHNDYHSWDLVQLEKDEWYHVDIYSDVSSKSQFRNFNMTDDVAKTGHEWDGSALPAAEGVKYSYAVQNGKEVEDIYAIPARLKKMIDKKKKSGFYKFKKKLGEEELTVANFMLDQMNTALVYVPDYGNSTIYGNWYLDENGQYILGLFIENYDDLDDSSSVIRADSPEGKKITKIIEKAFDVNIENPEEMAAIDEDGTADGIAFEEEKIE